MIQPALKPLIRIALTFAIVWFYFALTTGLVGGLLQVVVVVLLSIPTWVVLGRILFPTDGSGLRLPERRQD